MTTSWIKIPVAIVLARYVSAQDLKVYAVIRTHRNSVSGKCFPRLSTIAEESGLSGRRVTTIRNKLKELGVLMWTGGTGRGKRCYYDFPLEFGAEQDQIKVCEQLKSRNQLHLLEKTQKGEISDAKSRNGVHLMTNSENRPETQTQQGIAPLKKGEPQFTLTSNYKKELKTGCPSVPRAALSERDQRATLQEQKRQRERHHAQSLWVEVHKKQPSEAELERVLALMQRALTDRAIINTLKSSHDSTGGPTRPDQQ